MCMNILPGAKADRNLLDQTAMKSLKIGRRQRERQIHCGSRVNSGVSLFKLVYNAVSNVTHCLFSSSSKLEHLNSDSAQSRGGK